MTIDIGIPPSNETDPIVNKPLLAIVTNNHFDLVMCRGAGRRFVWNGRTYASYQDIQGWYMEDNLAMAVRHPEYKFEVECVAVVREFLRRQPQRKAELKALVQASRFTVAGAGDNIVDANLPLGESIVRNFTTGLGWLERELGSSPVMAVRNDGFGNSGQLPQILRGCGLRWLRGVSYAPINGHYWRGLDGSNVCVAFPTGIGYCEKAFLRYQPCPKCQGIGCEACRQRGIDPPQGAVGVPKNLKLDVLEAEGLACVGKTPEESMPTEEIFAWADHYRDRYEVRFVVQEELLPAVQALVNRWTIHQWTTCIHPPN